MSSAKIAITLEQSLVEKLDDLVKKHVFPNRSQAIQAAVFEKIEKIEHARLAIECAKLNPMEEQSLSEEGMSIEVSDWPAY